MNIHTNTSNNRIVRDQRFWNRSTTTTNQLMEGTMFSAMMKKGAYRVDYVNKNAAGTHPALGLYILGDLQAHEAYSHSAKHNLYLGLSLVREQLGLHNLVAIYLDVSDRPCPERPAYQSLKNDMQAGLFHRVLVLDPDHLYGDAASLEDWWRFYRQEPYCEVLTPLQGVVQPVPLFERFFSGLDYENEGSSLCLAL